MAAAALPHAYPFRFVDTVWEERDQLFTRGSARVRVTANARGAMGEGWSSPLLLAEAIAQAALLLEGGDPERSRRGFLAGIEGFEVARCPEAGETLRVEVRLVKRLGPVVRFDGEVFSDGESLARGSVLVRQGEEGAEP